MTIANVVIVRYGIVVLFFPAGAPDKILDFGTAVGQAKRVFSSTVLEKALIIVGIFVELVMPLGILSGVADRLAAFILAGYCAVTVILFKRFWHPGDFWKAREPGTGAVVGCSQEPGACAGSVSDYCRTGWSDDEGVRDTSAFIVAALRSAFVRSACLMVDRMAWRRMTGPT